MTAEWRTHRRRVLIVSYDLLKAVPVAVSAACKVVICDESHALKSLDTQRTKVPPCPPSLTFPLCSYVPHMRQGYKELSFKEATLTLTPVETRRKNQHGSALLLTYSVRCSAGCCSVFKMLRAFCCAAAKPAGQLQSTAAPVQLQTDAPSETCQPPAHVIQPWGWGRIARFTVIFLRCPGRKRGTW